MRAIVAVVVLMFLSIAAAQSIGQTEMRLQLGDGPPFFAYVGPRKVLLITPAAPDDWQICLGASVIASSKCITVKAWREGNGR